MSEIASSMREAGQHEDVLPGDAPRPRRRRVAAGVAVVLVLGAGAWAGWSAAAFSPAASSGENGGAAPPATQPVKRQDLSSATPVTGTLGYAGSYTVRGHGSGTLTWLPPPGAVISPGQVLYKTGNGNPVVLLHGSVPAWRTLDEGVSGADVTQLNHDLVALGDASSSQIGAAGWDYFSFQTQAAVEKLQSALGISSPSGSLSLGSVVFEPTSLRVTTAPGSLGGPASGPVLAATSDQHVVTISLDASQQSEVKAGDKVNVTLPDGTSTPGVVSSVGTVASGSGSNATIPVTVQMTHPQAAGSLDQAPVTVEITTVTVPGALVVPVGALLAQSSGGYAVEVTGPGNTRHLVPVTVGIFDDTDGLVQVAGALTPGQRVVVPAS
jgi:multidrug efflux pump subunit AcrA (membrane-fusion protein)